MGSQVNPTTQSLTLVKGNCQMGFQVNRAKHQLCLGLKEIARWDLRLTQPHIV